jgi:phosphotriesterase-related protein
MTKIATTLGPKTAAELGWILPHEHIFVDFRPPDHPEHGLAAVADVVALMSPEIEKAQALGVTALVDCTPVGVGRRVDLLKAVSEATGMPLVVPTGIYREPKVPAWAQAASEAELAAWMLSELQGEIEDSGVQAGWIKLSAGDDGITDCETKILRAAATAGRETKAVIGSHTIRGRVVQDQLDIIEAAGYTAERFIWIHTQIEPDFNRHLEMARRGAWLEYDGIGSGDDETYLEHIQRVLDAGLGDQLMLSHDRGWYDPAQPGGGAPKPFTYLFEQFLPKLRAVGVDEATIQQLMHDNPYRAFAR